MKIFIKLGFLIFTLFGINAYAEGNCPAGMYPIGGGNAGWVGCAPMNGYGSGNGGQNYNGSGRGAGHWVDSYGSLTWGKDSNGANVFGYSNKRPNKEQADMLALKYCEIAQYSNCQISFQFSNSYVAIVRDEKGELYANSNGKEEEAAKAAYESCQKNNAKECRIIKIIDSSASWVQ